MDDEDDDLYGGSGNALNVEEEESEDDIPLATEVKPERVEASEEDDDSEDDIQITTERPEGSRADSVPPPRKDAKKAAQISQEQPRSRPTSPDSSRPPPSKIRKLSPLPSTSTQATTTTTLPTHNGKEGKDFPSLRTSTLDLSANPSFPPINKPITYLEIDADLATHSKPWRLPGTDQTDFFNYGFDEYTWTQYCMRQQDMTGQVSQMKDQDAQFKAMLEGGGAPGGMPSMPGMPPEMMQMMMQSGMDPGKMDMGAMMGMMGGMGNGQSPHPGAQGQGFQPPSGPGGGFQDGGMGMEGFGGQMGMMGPQQGGGGGGRGRGRRGRGCY